MRVLLVIALAACFIACSARGPAGPAWPRSRAREADGGESLTPRAAARAIAAIVEDDRGAERTADKPAVAAVLAPTVERSVATPAVPSAEEPLPAEELIIEVDD